MKVIFLADVVKVAQRGEIKEVANGYALNVLIPKKLAILATEKEIKKIENQKKDIILKKDQEQKLFLEMIDKLQASNYKPQEIQPHPNPSQWEGHTRICISPLPMGGVGGRSDVLEISGHKHNKGHLFSAVSAEDIIQAIYQKIKVKLNIEQIILSETPIKSHGEYEIELSALGNRNLKRKIKILVK